MGIQNYEQHAHRLVEPDLPMQTRLQLAMEVRDSLEIAHTSEYLNFLKCYFRAFSMILMQMTKPQMTENVEHKLRNVVVDILNRLPHSEVLRPFVQDLLKVSLQVLTQDNEDNAIVAIRIIFDLLRNFRPTFESDLQPFLDFVGTVYSNFPSTVTFFFSNSSMAMEGNAGLARTAGPGSISGDDGNVSLDVSGASVVPYIGAGQLNPSSRSFKIMNECPLIVLFLFQLYAKLMHTNITYLLPRMVAALSIAGPERVPPHLKNQLVDFKGAQIKTLSFLTYLLKSSADSIRPHEENICKSIVNLLVTCPDSVSTRKELLISFKQVLGTEFRRGLFPLIDTLLEERVLVGTGRACTESAKPLAYSLLAEIVHHVRVELSLAQLSRVVYLFSRSLHDSSLNLTIRTTCARLLLNLAEPIFDKGIDQSTMDEARTLLVRVLDAFVSKFRSVKHHIPRLLEGAEAARDLSVPPKAALEGTMSQSSPPEYVKELNDYKHLVRSLVMGMKTIVWCITNAHVPRTPGMHAQMSNPTSSSPMPQIFKGMREDEVRKASGVLKNGVHCLAVFREKEEERDMVHHFSQILTIMEPRDLMDMFSLCMPHLFDCMCSSSQLLNIFSALLQVPKVLRPFTDVLVNFLVSEKLDTLKQPETPAAKLVLQLFRFIFVAVGKASAECERILQPHVSVIMEVCMKNAMEVDNPLGYLQLLRNMFRALSGGKFDTLLRDLIPLLQPCLNMLLAMLEGPNGDDMKDLILELCLTLPARLSALLPHLPRLHRPLVYALKGNDDLVSLGLRTLEYWVDSLNPDFLEPNMANIMSEVILALWAHLRPPPHPWGAKCLQLLGKLGGRNRRFLKEPLSLECRDNSEHGLRLILTFEPATPFLVPLDRCIHLAVAAVMQKGSSLDPFYRKQTMRFIRICLVPLLNLTLNISGEGVSSGHLEPQLLFSMDPGRRRMETPVTKLDLGVKTKMQLFAEKSIFKALLTTIIAASADAELATENDEFLENVCHHFAMVFHVDGPPTNPSNSRARGSVGSNLKDLDPLLFLDALVEVLSGECRLHAKAALRALNMFVETVILLTRCKQSGAISSTSSITVYGQNSVIHTSVFEQLLLRLLHCCYGVSWQSQIGGVMGIGALVNKVPIETICGFLVRIVRGLVYVLKRLPVHANKEQEETSQVLNHVLRVVDNADEAINEFRKQSFQGVVEFLASELFNPNASITVRKNVQSCLSFLANRTGSEVSELLEPLYQPLLQPLIARPLRQKNIEQQVGTVTAMNFCLALRPPLLKLTQEVVSFLQDALQIADADETIWVVKCMNPKVLATFNKLRTACIQLLCTAMMWADFKTPNHADLRARIISMFFKSLTCRTPEIVAVAKEGLRLVIQQQRMPKELLQNSLRPILVNLAHTKSLTMPLLQGLARLLELLSVWFNVTLGVKLLDHLKKWLEPEKLAQSQRSWKAGDEPKVAAAMIELFHLLPPAAIKFLDDLVTITIDLEGALPPGQIYSEINSPYTLPLTKFLNRYATEAVDYFLERLNQPKYFRRFIDIVQSKAGEPLREEVAKSPRKILERAFPEFVQDLGISVENFEGRQGELGSGSVAYFHGLRLICTLVKLMPEWLHQNRIVFDALVFLWKSPERMTRLQNEQGLNLVQVKESKWLIKCFLNYLRHDKSEVGVLFDMMSIFLLRTCIDFEFLKKFYATEVACGYSPSLRKTVLLHFLNLFQSKQLGQDQLVVSMQTLILPMLSDAFQKDMKSEVIDPSILKTIVEKLLDPPEEVSAEYDESLRVELLQLATLLLKYLQNDLVLHRKELIKFGWNHLKREDNSSKQWAFVNVCHFLEAYQAPEKIILQVFIALLRTCQPENRLLVRQALDILMPALPKRLPPGDSRVPIWIRYTKKILVEEGHSIPNLIHIFQLIVRHSELFYSCRAQFVPQMVNSLSRLGLPFTTTTENRRLAIKLAGLVVSWEKQRQTEARILPEREGHGPLSEVYTPGSVSTELKRPPESSSFPDDLSKRVKVEPGLQSLSIMSPGGASFSSTDTPGSTGHADEEYKPNAAMEEMIINFLIRVALVIELKDKESIAMYNNALELLSSALEVWPNANVKFNYLEKILGSFQPSQSRDPAAALAQGLEVMNKALEKQPQLFIRNNINHIAQILEPCFNSKMLDAGKSLCSLLKMVFGAFPLESPDTPQDVKMLYQRVEDLIQKHLAAVTAPQISLETSTANAVISFILFMVKSLSEVQNNFVDPFIVPLVRVLQRLMRDMGSSSGSHVRQSQKMEVDSAVNSHPASDSASVIPNMKSILKLISERVMHSPDSKRSITQILHALLTEKTTDHSVLMSILDAVKLWIEAVPAANPTLTPKETIVYLQKLSQIERQKFSSTMIEEWDRKYLQLLYGVCSDSAKYPSALRHEAFQKVERQYMMGLRAKDPEIRQRFFLLYNDAIEKTLFIRLQFIIQQQDWEAVSDCFWLKQGLDLLLAILVENEPINLAPTSSRIPPLIVPGLFSDHSMLDATERSEGDAVSFQSLVGKHVRFLNEMGKLQVSDLVVPLRDLAHIDANVAYHLWVLVFPIVWVTLQKEEQTQLAKPMIALLSKDYHKKQQSSRPNVVQALIEGLHLSHPQPRMPSDLIKYIGKTYNSWSISLSLLENHVMWFTNDTKCCESLAELYRLLNEDDMRCGLWKKRSITAETRAGLSLVQHGYWQQAQNLFYQAMIKATQGTYNNAVPKAEMCLWEEHWIYCAKQLSQWEPLSDFGKSIENYEILLDSLWKVPDWVSLKDVISKAQVEETPKLRLIQSFFALHDRNPNGIPEAENLINRGIELALERWWQLPDMAVQSRMPLLQQFQQLVEVQESSRSLLDISNGNKQSSLSGSPASGSINVSYAELKDILDSWKLRTPNEWDNVSVWYDLLQWRNEIYNVVIDNFKDFASSNPQLHHLGYRDKAWNVNRLARMARRQGLHGVCVNILEKMYGHSTMEVQEAFVKIREQAKAYLEMRGELTSGLNLINSTNLEYFPAKNKAEIFRLKGDFLVKMSDSENANVAYSTAISLYKNLPKGWASWGNYCDLVYKETGDEVWLEYAVACFLQAIKCGVSNPRSHLARILYLLSFDSPNEPVGRAFDKYMEQVPHWVWLSWIPQLLLSLQRNEASHAKLVLMKIAAVFPQALYYWLRTYLMERRDITNKSDVTRTLAMVQRLQQSSGTSTQAGSSESGPAQEGSGDSEKPSSSEPGGPGSVPDLSSASESIQSALKRINHPPGYMASVTAAFEAAKDIMEALRNKHTNMANELESLLSEIGSRFVTLPEERLLAVVNALVHRCYKYPTATVAEVPLSLKKELSGVCRACFSADAVNKHVDFVREYKKDFESDLDPESPTFPATLSELTERLKHWKSILQCNVEDRFPAALKLEDESKTLRDFHVVDVEIPGQYFTDQDVAADHTIKLDRIGPDVPIVRRHGSSFRRLTLIGSDGSQSHFIVQTSLTPNARSDERILQLFRVLNKMFDKHKESRRRHLSIHAPIIIPVWSQVRMVEDDVTYSTLLEVYDMNCARNNREADLPITRFKEQLNQAITGQIPSDNVIDLRLQAYNEITKTLVPDNIFSQYMYKILSNGNHLWAFKKQFAVQLALSCFVSYMLQIGGRSPNKTLFSRSTGKIFQTDFHPAYDANGMVEFSEPVPFRLTRNMQAFFSQFGVEGPVVSAMCAAAQAVVSPKQSDHIWYQLGMFFRDELLQWSWRRPPGSHPAAANTAGGVNTLDFQQKVNFNVDQVVDRVKSIAPVSDEEEENPTDPPQSVQRGVSELIDAALMPRNLCMMDPTWHPWF